ncbi:2078_t:CDS:2, partial [Gigaspora margarita]
NIDSETKTEPEDDYLELTKNKNQVPKVSHLTAEETQIAASVLKIHTANHCNIHNRACLNVDKSKEYHIKITFMMLSTWNKGLATSTEPPTHPLFAYHLLSKKKSSILSSQSLNISSSPPISSSSSILSPTISSPTILSSQPPSSFLFPNSSMLPLFYNNSLQMTPIFNSLHLALIPTPYLARLLMPTIDEFLKLVDENENTDDYYQGFLTKFMQQRISVRILSILSDEKFNNCDVNTIGAQQTLPNNGIICEQATNKG